MRKGDVISATAIAIVAVSIKPIRQLVKNTLRKVIVIPLSSLTRVIGAAPLAFMRHRSWESQNLPSCASHASAYSTLVPGLAGRTDPPAAHNLATTSDPQSHTESSSSDEYSPRSSDSHSPDFVTGLGYANSVHVESRSTFEITPLPPSPIYVHENASLDATSNNVEREGALTNGPTVVTRRVNTAPPDPFNHPTTFDQSHASHGPNQSDLESALNNENERARLRAECRARGRVRGRARGRGRRGRGRGRGKVYGSGNASDVIGNQHDPDVMENDEDGDGLVTCVRCGASGHYAGDCERPFGPVRRTWPIGLKALARRLRVQADEPVVWCD